MFKIIRINTNHKALPSPSTPSLPEPHFSLQPSDFNACFPAWPPGLQNRARTGHVQLFNFRFNGFRWARQL